MNNFLSKSPAVIFIGAGDHAKSLYAIIVAQGSECRYFIDAPKTVFYDARKLKVCALDEEFKNYAFVLAIGGITPKKLEARYMLWERYRSFDFPPLCAPSATICFNASVGQASIIGHQSILNTESSIGKAVIINTGVIIEHDVTIEDGAHICPGAVVLGGATIGKCALVGANAVVLPYTIVPPFTLVRAGSRYP